MALYDANGEPRLTVVDGSVYTGLYAADGSYNIVLNDGNTLRGVYHPCGAYNAVVYTSGTQGFYSPNGSVYVVTNTAGTGYTFMTSKEGEITAWPPDSNDLNTMLEGTTVIWDEPFNVLSLRTGGYATGTLTTGYNASTSRGTWSPNGENYMTSTSSYVGANSHTKTINPAYDWSSIDSAFRPIGDVYDITSDGLVLKATGDHPLIRTALGNYSSGNPYYIGALLSTASAAKFSYPYMIRINFTFNSMGNEDFPALWALGEHYALLISDPTYKHNEVDYMERFGADYTPALRRLSAAYHIDNGGMQSSGTVATYGSDLGPDIPHELVAFRSADKLKVWMDGTLVANLTLPSVVSTDRDHIILNSLLGMTWRAYVAGLADAVITVRSIEVLKPAATANDLIPLTPPTPALSGFTNTVSNGTNTGTVVGTLSGASTYRVIGYTGLTTSGSNLVTNGTLTAGTYDFYIEGTDAAGTPAIIPKYTLTVTASAPALTLPTMTATDKAAADIAVTTDNATGTLYWIADTNTSTASQAQVKAGQNASGSAAAYSGSVVVSGTGVQTITNAITASAADTAYSVQFMHESSGAVQSAVAVAATTSTFTQEAYNVYNLFTTPATTARRKLINDFIKGCMTDGTWTKLDAVQIYAAADSQAALIDWKNTARSITLTGSPTHNADSDFTTDGATNYITTGIQPSVGPNWTLNSAYLGIWSRESAATSAFVIQGGTTSSQVNLCARVTGDNIPFRVNMSTGGATVTNNQTNGLGYASINRTASNSLQPRKNGASVGSAGTTVAQAVTSNALRIGYTYFPGYVVAKLGAVITGGGISNAEDTLIYNRLRTYMTGVGVP